MATLLAYLCVSIEAFPFIIFPFIGLTWWFLVPIPNEIDVTFLFSLAPSAGIYIASFVYFVVSSNKQRERCMWYTISDLQRASLDVIRISCCALVLFLDFSAVMQQLAKETLDYVGEKVENISGAEKVMYWGGILVMFGLLVGLLICFMAMLWSECHARKDWDRLFEVMREIKERQGRDAMEEGSGKDEMDHRVLEESELH